MSNLHDLAKIGYVIENYDKIREGKISRQYRNRDGSLAKTVELQKKIGDDFYYVVEAVPDAKLQTLHVVSAYKNKNDTFIEKAVPNGPSRYVQDESQSDESFSNNIVSQTSKNATAFDDLPIRKDIVQQSSVLDDDIPIREDIPKKSSGENVWDMSEESWEEYMKQGEEELTKDLSPAQKEKFTRKKLHQKIMDNIKARFQEKGFNFDVVLSDAKNKSTFASVDNTPQRYLEKTLGYKEGQLLSDLTVNQTAQNEAKAIKWLNSFTDRKTGLLAQISS